MEDDEIQRARDDVRCEMAVQTILDVLRRFEEINDGAYSVYDLVGYVVEDLVRDGCCAACFSETITAVFQEVGADPTVHVQAEGTVH
tara:strand:+ start:8216 stop:8476 length:261 start_codon:yes stop_codon:yes gene_type:complete